VQYAHLNLKPVLEATYGVPVYQEQVMRMAQEIAGYSLAMADFATAVPWGRRSCEENGRQQRKRFVEVLRPRSR